MTEQRRTFAEERAAAHARLQRSLYELGEALGLFPAPKPVPSGTIAQFRLLLGHVLGSRLGQPLFFGLGVAVGLALAEVI